MKAINIVEIRVEENKKIVAKKRYVMTDEQYKRTYEFLERLLTEETTEL